MCVQIANAVLIVGVLVGDIDQRVNNESKVAGQYFVRDIDDELDAKRRRLCT